MNPRLLRVALLVVLVVIGVVASGAIVISRARRVSDIHRITANAQLLSKALREYQQRTGVLPSHLEDLVADNGDVIPGYLSELTNLFAVAYAPGVSTSAPILSLADNNCSVTVSRDFRVHVTK